MGVRLVKVLVVLESEREKDYIYINAKWQIELLQVLNHPKKGRIRCLNNEIYSKNIKVYCNQ